MPTRQSISLTDPNNQWLEMQVEGGEFTNKSDALNDLIRQARRQEELKIQAIREGLIRAEESIREYGYSTQTPEGRLEKFKQKARENGSL